MILYRASFELCSRLLEVQTCAALQVH